MDGLRYRYYVSAIINYRSYRTRLYSKLNYLSLCGVLAGSMTDPPALAFANSIKEGSGAASLSYATVYPLAMFLRIVSPQLLALLLWSFT